MDISSVLTQGIKFYSWQIQTPIDLSVIKKSLNVLSFKTRMFLQINLP